ncbi:junctional adhesion molecule-like isoform X2 [Mugil cephalus]|uniref:junctional adhesion molecule-like isoform X2 n=1 Tax=Mugil cephalus TaxID=48193 RepID=UPI001FB7BDDD|nr:junctional adhesion molecule-like isoform X2 [Mugil cephalus]
MSLCLMLMLLLTAVTHVSTITVRVGDDVTLPCDKIKDLNDECNSTTWLFSDTGSTSPLFEYGKIHEDVGSKSDSLNVTTNCSLVIKKVTDDDDGRYICRQFSKSQQVTESDFRLTVIKTPIQVSTTTVRVGDDVTLPCDKIKDLNDECNSTTWLFSDTGSTSTLFEYGKIHEDVGSKSNRLNVTTNCSLVIKKVTDEDDGRYICRQFISGRRRGADFQVVLSVINREEATSAAATTPTLITLLTTATTRKTTDRPSATATTTTVETQKTTTAKSTTDETSTTAVFWTRFVFVSVGLAALTLTVVLVNMSTTTKGYKGHSGENVRNNEDEGVVIYENVDAASVRPYRLTN